MVERVVNEFNDLIFPLIFYESVFSKNVMIIVLSFKLNASCLSAMVLAERYVESACFGTFYYDGLKI